MYFLVRKGTNLYNVLIQDTRSYKRVLGWRIADGSWVNNDYKLSWIAYDHPDYKPIFNFGEE